MENIGDSETFAKPFGVKMAGENKFAVSWLFGARVESSKLDSSLTRTRGSVNFVW